MKITDGKKTVEIRIQKWNGSGYDPDWSIDYFSAVSLPYDEETDTYTVYDVDDSIDTAVYELTDEDSEFYDEDMRVFVDEI